MEHMKKFFRKQVGCFPFRLGHLQNELQVVNSLTVIAGSIYSFADKAGFRQLAACYGTSMMGIKVQRGLKGMIQEEKGLTLPGDPCKSEIQSMAKP
jgi:hypothetical protein